jgi:hypothetical protein
MQAAALEEAVAVTSLEWLDNVPTPGQPGSSVL